MDRQEMAGYLFLAGAAVFIIGMAAAQLLRPGYSLSQNYISDLGVGGFSYLFNGSAIFLGLAVIAASFLLTGMYMKKYLAFVAAGGVGAILVGIFPAPSLFHTAGAFLAFSIGGAFALSSWKLMKKPLAYATALGVVSLISLVLWIWEIYLGLGPGGMERAVAYPILIFLLVFGYSLAKGNR
jgi:hypothetical membrane protein